MKVLGQPNDGVYYNMDEEIYHTLPRLSASGIKRLLVSGMDFWVHSWMNPSKPEGKTRAFDVGKAYHKRLLEGEQAFTDTYSLPFNSEDYPDALDTVEDLKEECRRNGLAVSGTKGTLIQRIRDLGLDIEIIETLKLEHYDKYGTNHAIDADIYHNVINAGSYMDRQKNNPFKGGHPEVSVLWTDQATGVPMKARFDYLVPRHIYDLKTFANSMNSDLNVAITRSIATYKYHVQAAAYIDAHLQAFHDHAAFTFIFMQTGQTIFAAGKYLDQGSLLLQTGNALYRKGIEKFAEYYNKYGEKPWLDDMRINMLEDQDMPMWMFDE